MSFPLEFELIAKGDISTTINKATNSRRVIGNHTVHPGQIDMKDNKEIAIKLFGLLNMVVHEMITVPKETDRIFDIIPEKEQLNIKKEITSKSFNSFYIKL